MLKELVQNRKRKRTNRPLRRDYDPSRTATLAARLGKSLDNIFVKLLDFLYQFFVVEDALGLSLDVAEIRNVRYIYRTSPDRLRIFEQELRHRLGLISADIEELYQTYIRMMFEQGQLRSLEDILRIARDPNVPPRFRADRRLDFYRDNLAQFLRDSFAQPASKEALQLLVGRTFTELRGITDQMASVMTRVLADALAMGEHPKNVYKELSRQVGISVTRAKTIARTELARAQSEGQLVVYEQYGLDEVEVLVEWTTARDESVCALCKPLHGVVFELREARGLIPRHPNCRCAFIPANVGEDTSAQIRDPSGISKLIRRSIRAEGGSERSKWVGADLNIRAKRPKGLVRKEM